MKKNNQYGFQSHLSSEFPSQIVIDVTEICNLACIHCPQSEFSKSVVSRKRYLPLHLHNKLVDEVKTNGEDHCQYLRYTAQGEPLLHPKLIEMITYSASQVKASINLTTNGLLLKEDKAIRLLEAGIDVIDISIDANTAETYDLIRKRGNFSRTQSNVLGLIDLIKSKGFNTKVVVSFVEQSLNLHETSDFEKFWNANGADYVVIRRLHSAGGERKELVNVNIERYPCLYPWERLTLGPDGCIHYCPQDWRHGSVICDFETTTIKDVWQGDFMKRLRDAHLKNCFSEYEFCKQCPDWSTTRWPQNDRSYSNMMHEFSLSDKTKE